MLLALEEAWIQPASEHLYVRLLPALVALGAMAVLARDPADTPVRRWSHWAVLAVSAALLLSYALRPESELVPLRGRLLGPALIYLLAPNTLLKQAGTAIALSTGFMLLRAVRLEPFVALSFANDALFLVVLNVAGVLRSRSRLTLEHQFDTAWERETTARLAAEQARAEVRTLQGIIPICMHCRKLRTGTGEWQRLESYVREQTGAEFSHGVCPECLDEHYPDPGNGEPPRERTGWSVG